MTRSNSNAVFVCPTDIFTLPVTLPGKLIYAALCCERDTSGVIAPSYKDLADRARVHSKTAQKAVKQLQRVGAVVRIPRFAESGAQLSNRYFVTAFGDELRNDADFVALVKRMNDFMQAVS